MMLAFWLRVPFFVVTKTTPFAAREPYSALAAASFDTTIDSISSGLIVESADE